MTQVARLARILVVEDQDDSRELLVRTLGKRGHEVKAFAHANGNLDAMVAFDPDVALVDVRMPGRSGDELAPELLVRCPNTLIIFLTGEPNIESLKAAVPNCFVIRKPVDFTVLFKLVDCL